MKKIVSLILIVLTVFSLILSLSSCSNNETSAQNNQTYTKPQPRDESEYINVVTRVGSLKGPTTIGLVNLMNASKNGKIKYSYDFTMETQASELSAKLVQGTLDIALIPANLAANLYNKTDGNIVVIDINTLGVLYCITGDTTISKISDLEGKTIVTTGQGTTPEYAIRYLLAQNKVNATLEFKSEANEIASILNANPETIAVLPQPFATTVLLQNENLKSAFSLNDEWDAVSGNTSNLVTGVTVVRKEFLNEYPELVEHFITEHKKSVSLVSLDLSGTSQLVVDAGIIPKAPVAQKAIPLCNIVCLTNLDMKTSLSGYLQTLYELNAQSIGGKMPNDDFYYVIEQ